MPSIADVSGWARDAKQIEQLARRERQQDADPAKQTPREGSGGTSQYGVRQ